MKKYLFILLFSISSTFHLSAQQVYVQLGRVGAGFDYKDSEGNSIDNLYTDYQFSYALGFQYSISKRFYPFIAVTYNRYEVYGSDNQYDNSYRWKLGYLGATLGMEGEILRKGPFRVLASLALEPQFMLDGTQTINSNVYELKGVEQFENPFMLFKAGAGINYCLDDRLAITARYEFGKGFPLGSSEDPEVLRLNTQTVSIGLRISLMRCDYCYKTHF